MKFIFKKRLWAQKISECYVVNYAIKKPDDFVIATGKQTTVKNFVNIVETSGIKLKWKGSAWGKVLDENGRVIVACDKAYYRPLEVNNLLGDARKARKI